MPNTSKIFCFRDSQDIPGISPRRTNCSASLAEHCAHGYASRASRQAIRWSG